MTKLQDQLVQWMLDRQNRYAYSQGPTRLDPEAKKMTDCSALVRYAYLQVAGIEVGTWTGNQQDRGRIVVGLDVQSAAEAERLLQKGDLVFFDWDGINVGYFDHVEMYIGNGQTIGHGGPGNGPTIKSLAQQWEWAHSVVARRYLPADLTAPEPTAAPVSAQTPAPAPAKPRVSFPTFPWSLDSGHYLGDINGPDQSHGGYFANEKPLVRAVQQALIIGGYVPGITDPSSGWADGIWEQPTTDALAAWQRDHMPHTTYWGQCWADDYAKLQQLYG